jgi:hypothetical protein
MQLLLSYLFKRRCRSIPVKSELAEGIPLGKVKVPKEKKHIKYFLLLTAFNSFSL